MTVEIKVHDGVRNDVSSERFTPRDLLVGNNVDIDSTGKTFRRLGRTELSDQATYSLWSDGKQAFYVRGASLYELNPDLTSTVMDTAVRGTVAYTSLDRAVYWTDGLKSGRVKDGINMRWGVEVPANTYALTTVPGDMPAGTYGVTIVNTRNGMESGARRGKFIDVPANGAIRIQNIPVPVDPHIDGKSVYITRPDGSIFFRSALLLPEDTDVTVFSTHTDSVPLRTQFKSPAPAGQVVSLYNGRAYVAVGPVLYYSDPYEYELFDLANNYIVFESNIMISAPVNDGMFLATENETYFLVGDDPQNFVSSIVLPKGGVMGTLTYPRNDKLTDKGVQGVAAMWVSHVGVVLGTTGGGLVNMTGDRYEIPAARKGSGLFKMRSGTPQYVSTLFN